MPRTAAGDPSVKKSLPASTSIGSTLLRAQQANQVERRGTPAHRDSVMAWQPHHCKLRLKGIPSCAAADEDLAARLCVPLEHCDLQRGRSQ
jgi:hypothetical protein